MSLPMAAREVAKAWLKAVNNADVTQLRALYARDAVFGLVAEGHGVERNAVEALLATRPAATLHVVNLLEDGEWAVLEWRNTQGLRGCDLFNIRYGRIVVHRRYAGRNDPKE
jgi:ketosteroid isomerase-like protein